MIPSQVIEFWVLYEERCFGVVGFEGFSSEVYGIFIFFDLIK